MPRKSLEALAAAQTVFKRPEPPQYLSYDATVLWHSIVDDRPSDYFRPGNQELLALYCQMTVEIQAIVKAAHQKGPENGAYPYDIASLHKMGTLALQIAARLRLTQQQTSEIKSAKPRERVAPEAAEMPPSIVLGGASEFSMRAN